MLSYAEFLAHFDADAHLLAAAAARGLDAPVPGCPGWSIVDLVDHVSRVYTRSTDIIEQGLVDTWPPRRSRPDDADSLEFFRTEAHRLATLLAGADPAAPAVAFAADKSIGFWIRRMAHETLIHRIDAEQAHGYESLVDPALALDGIAEMLEVFVTRFPDWGEFVPENDAIKLEAAGKAWTVRLGRFVGSRNDKTYDLPKAILVDDAQPAAKVTGDPARLLLWMWGRAPLSDLIVNGEVHLARRFREVCSI